VNFDLRTASPETYDGAVQIPPAKIAPGKKFAFSLERLGGQSELGAVWWDLRLADALVGTTVTEEVSNQKGTLCSHLT